MRRLVLLLTLSAAVALPAEAATQGALAYTAARCDQGGTPWTGSWPGFSERPCTPGIFVMDDDGANQRRLTKGHSEGEEARSGDGWPSWSPAGDRIAFSRQSGGAEERIFMMNANGSEQRQLIPGGVPGASGERAPSWARTGGHIAFFAYGTQIGFGSIFVVRPDGTGLRQVSPVGQVAHHPTFAPDGKHIVYFGYTVGSNDSALWLADRDGGEPRRVTAGDFPISSNGVSFSPSGRWLALTLPIDNKPQIHAMRTDGSELRRIEGAQGVTPTWSGLGNAIFFTNGSDAYSVGIFRLDLKNGATPKPLTKPGEGAGRADWSAAGRFTSLIPRLDELAPLTIVGDLPGTTGRPPGKIPYLATDISGISRVDAAVGLRSAGRCRFLQRDGKLGARRSCSDPDFEKAPLDRPGWRKRTKGLPKGTYEVRIRATDGKGNTTRKPKRRVVRVK